MISLGSPAASSIAQRKLGGPWRASPSLFVKAFLPRLYKFFSRVRQVFGFRYFSLILMIALAVLGAQYIDSSYKPFIPAFWQQPLTRVAIVLSAFLVIIPLINRLAFALERGVQLRYLRSLDAEEKAALQRFIAEDRTIDVPLDFPSDYVSHLLNIGLLASGSGIFYPKSEMNPKPYSYFSIPTWVFQTLKQNPGLLDNRDPK